jgi:hypothetical protein
MPNWEMPDLNRVIRGVVFGLPPTFFVCLHLAGGPGTAPPFTASGKSIVPGALKAKGQGTGNALLPVASRPNR